MWGARVKCDLFVQPCQTTAVPASKIAMLSASRGCTPPEFKTTLEA